MSQKYGFGILAIILTVALVAFKNAPDFQPPLANNWYIYNGSTTDPQNQASYYSLEGEDHDECENATKLCAILIMNDDGTLTNGEVQALINAANGNTTSSTFPVESAYVDFKD